MSPSETMSGTHDCGGDAAAYVLGALDPDEVQEFERHIEGCTVCRDELNALRGVVDALPLAAPQYSAPKKLRRRSLHALRQEARRAPAARPRRRSDFRSNWTWRGVVAAGVCAVFAVAVVTGLDLSSGSHPRVIQARVSGISGSASVHLVGDRGELIVHRLSPPPPGDIYEVWLERAHRTPAPTSVLFSVTAAGAGEIGLPPRLHGVSEIMVTPEPAGGSPFPTHSPVIVARLS